MRLKARSIESAGVVAALVLFTGAFRPLYEASADVLYGHARVSVLEVFLWGGLYAMAGLLAVTRWRSICRAAIREATPWLLVGLALLSSRWSAAPGFSALRGVELAAATIFAAFLAVRYSPRELLGLLAWALGIAGGLSWAFGLLVETGEPSAGGWLAGQAWAGIYIHKNTLGRMMALGATVYLILAVADRRVRWRAIIGLAASFGLLVLSSSATALVTLLALAALLPICRSLRWEAGVRAPFLAIAVLLAGSVSLVVLGNFETILALLGRDATLTGRTLLWQAVLDRVGERFWHGYGFGAFWLGPYGPSARIWRVLSWQPGHGHNGFLDLWLSVGVVGVAIYAFGFTRAILRAGDRLRRTAGADGLWPVLCLAFVLLSSMTENGTVLERSILWLLFVTVANQLVVWRPAAPAIAAAAGPGDARTRSSVRAS